MASHYQLTQIITEPIHILEDSSSCRNFVCTSQPNMVLESGAHSLLHPNSRHQITFEKFDLKDYYRPPYQRRFWHYKYVYTAKIKNALVSFNWENKHFLTASSIRRFQLLMKQSSIL